MIRFVALALLLGVSSAQADGAIAKDHARIETCLAQKTASACFFVASNTCFETEVSHAPNPGRARAWCDLRELDVWQSVIDQSLISLRQDLAGGTVQALEDQHAHWISGKELSCAFPYEYLRGSWVSSGAARCHLKRVQWRAAELLDYVEFARHQMFVGQPGKAE